MILLIQTINKFFLKKVISLKYFLKEGKKNQWKIFHSARKALIIQICVGYYASLVYSFTLFYAKQNKTKQDYYLDRVRTLSSHNK